MHRRQFAIALRRASRKIGLAAHSGASRQVARRPEVQWLEPRILTSFSPLNSAPNIGSGPAKSAVDPTTGDIYVATENGVGLVSDFAVTRFTSSGVLDTSWGGNRWNGNPGIPGTYILPSFDTSNKDSTDYPYAIAVSSNGGAIAVVGTSSICGWAVAMLYNDYDSTTGTFGDVAWQKSSSFQRGIADAVTFDPSDGAILVAGGNGGANMVVAQLNGGTGNLDTSFGDADPNNPGYRTGIKTIENDNPSGDSVYATTVLELQNSIANDFVMVAGYTNYTDGVSASDMTLVRLTDSGDYDTTFGDYNRNYATTRTNFGCNPGTCVPQSTDAAYALAEWYDHTTGSWYLYAAGTTNVSGSNRAGVARYIENAARHRVRHVFSTDGNHEAGAAPAACWRASAPVS